MEMLQNLLFDWINKGQDTWMSMLTMKYLAGLASIFVFFLLWYLVPICLRWLQIKLNHWFVNFNLKNVENLKENRKKIELKIFKNTGWARDYYHNFRMAWEDARLPNEDKAVYPIHLKEFLSPELVIDRAVNRRIAEALPGIFVALGIFGTFLGLVLGLKGLRIDELANLKQGVGQLISGLSLAFYTSLFGIAFSIIFSFTYRFFVRRLEKALYRLDELFTILFPYHSYERYVRKHFELQADVKQGLQTLATDVAMKIRDTIAPAMDEALVKHLVPIMHDLQMQIRKSIEESKQQQVKILGNLGEHIEKMSSVITDHFENSQKKQSEAMEEVLSQYVEKMNETFISQFQDMGRIIEETTKVQSEIKVQMVQFTEQLQNQFRIQIELIEKTSRAGQILSESLESLEGISRELKSSASDIASAATLLKEAAAKAMEGQETLRESMEGQIQAMTTTRAELEKAWNTITADTESTIQLVRQVIKELAEGVGEQLNNALTAFDGTVAEVVERFSGTLSEANQTIEELPAVLIKMGESFDGIRTDISALKEILKELKSLTTDIVAPNIEKAIESSNDFSRTAESIKESTERLHGGFQEIIKSIKLGGETLERKARDTYDEFKGLTDEFLLNLSHVMRILGDEGSLHSVLVEINDTITKIDQQSFGSDEGLKQAVEGLNGSLSSLKAQVEKITERDGKMNEELVKAVKFIAARANDFTKEIRSELFDELKSIKESTIRMVDATDDLKSSLSQPEARRGLFGRIMKR